MNYDGVILYDRPANELLGQASRERLVASGPHDEFISQVRRLRNAQDALSLLVLFDRLLLPVFYDTIRIPALEDNGIIELVPFEWISPKVGKTRADIVVEVLERALPFRPFVLAGMAQYEDRMSRIIADALHVPVQLIHNAFIDLALAFYRGRTADLESNLLHTFLPKPILKVLFSMLESPPPDDDSLSSVDNILLSAWLCADEITQLLSLSDQHHVPVATTKYAVPGAAGKGLWKSAENAGPLNLADTFALVRFALNDIEAIYLPRIEGVKHALGLRRDPHLKALREQLSIFQSSISTGDITAATEIRMQVQKAVKALRRARRWERPVKWASYMGLPITTVETLLQGLPIGSFLLGVPVVAATAWTHWVERKYEWALFGK